MVGWWDGLEANCLFGRRRAIGGFCIYATFDVLEVAVERRATGGGLFDGLFGQFRGLEIIIAGV